MTKCLINQQYVRVLHLHAPNNMEWETKEVKYNTEINITTRKK